MEFHYLVFTIEDGCRHYISGFDKCSKPLFTTVREQANHFCEPGAIIWLNRGLNIEMRGLRKPLLMIIVNATDDEINILDREGYVWYPRNMETNDIIVEGNDEKFFEMCLHNIGRIL